MKTRYNQGWRQGRADVQAQAADEKGMLISVLIVLGLFIFDIGAVVLLGGCATTLIAEKRSLTEVGDHQTIRGLVRVAQMNVDCDKQDTLMKRIVSDIMVGAGAPAPDKLDIRLLPGSSLCGIAQGVAESVRMPELGARYLAVAEATLYWSSITYAELKKAQAVLAAMRPIASRKFGAKLR